MTCEKDTKKKNLYDRVIDDNNIYLAIYKIKSYIFEKELLEDKDKRLLESLQDNLNERLIKGVIIKVKTLIEKNIKEDELFEVTAYLRPKKLDSQGKDIIFRPLHTSNLYSQIAMVAMLQVLIYDEKEEKIVLNELNTFIPNNFYGNIISQEAHELYIPWQQQYRKYSNDITQAYERYLDTGEYKYQIALDIEEFFPSIDPFLVYQIIYKKFAIKYEEEDKEILKQILFRLLHFRIKNIKGYEKEYYGNKYKKGYNNEFCKGVAQGLPTAYFFANIIMTEITRIFEQHFKGDAYYYVDDSVIYTKENNEFDKKLKIINSDINIWMQKNMKDIEYPKSKHYLDKIKVFERQCSYEIKIHLEGKSSFNEVSKADQGQGYLGILSKMASVGAMDLKNIFSDIDNVNLEKKFCLLEETIDKELERVKVIVDSKMNSEEKTKLDNKYAQYKKMLIRFYKFFKFRRRILEDTCIMELSEKRIDEFTEIFKFKNDKGNIDLERYFNKCDEDIFGAEFIYILTKLQDKQKYNELRDTLIKFNKSIYNNSENSNDIAYYYKVLDSLAPQKRLISNENTSYKTIQIDIQQKLPRFYSENTRLDFMEEFICGLGNRDERDNKNYGYYLTKNIPDKFVNQLSDENIRKVLNTVLSLVMNVKVDDDITPYKLDNRPLTYLELRIISYIRNRQFELGEFIRLSKEMSIRDTEIIDYGILQILDYFRKMVKNPNRIDNLIQVHRYTTNMWKNGSKFLHFYTLHNQEHAIELIRASISVVKSMEFMQITSLDYYILFIACYLHDISMVVYPDINRIFNREDNYKGNLIYSQFLQDIDKEEYNIDFVSEVSTKELLISYYKKMDELFEEYTRLGHAKQSGDYIKQTKDLSFIDETIKEIVAEVSAAHGYNTQEIYNVKSVAKENLISKKFLKIILRVADLLDMSENRVTNAILDNNIRYMAPITQFHWISHKAISNYQILTEYNNTLLENQVDKNKSYLHKDNMVETIKFIIKINVKQWEKVEALKCNNKVWVKQHNEPNKLIIDIKDDKEASDCQKECNFMCKWMSKKNEYFYEELYELQKYLKRSKESNYFTTKIKIILEMEEKEKLKQTYYDLLKREI